MRSNIDASLSIAINLTVLKKLATKLGSHAKYLYKTSFLDPELLSDPEVNNHIEQLIRIDNKGLFISVFANELHYLGEETFSNSDRSNRTSDVINFLNYLIKIAERGLGEHRDLQFYSDSIKTAIILLAIPDKASTLGVTPYLTRLRMNFNDGCKSVYVLSYPSAFEFLKIILRSVGKDDRYETVNSYRLFHGESSNNTETRIALIRTNPVFSDQNLANTLAELGVAVGAIIQGTVTDASASRAVITFAGINCFIEKAECSWYSIASCRDELILDERYSFRIKDISYSNSAIELTRRFDEDDPWDKSVIPSEGDVIEIIPQRHANLHLICLTDDRLEVKVPESEVVWGILLEQDVTDLIGKRVAAKVLLVQNNVRLVRASIRQLNPNPWEEIKSKFPPGTTIMGAVVAKPPNL